MIEIVQEHCYFPCFQDRGYPQFGNPDALSRLNSIGHPRIAFASNLDVKTAIDVKFHAEYLDSFCITHFRI